MIGDYVLHYPLTDFAVGLLVIAALLELGRIVLDRAGWATAVDLLLVLGCAGALVAVGSGLWLVSEHAHPDTETLSLHHWFAYSTLGVAALTCLARALQSRSPRCASVKTAGLLISAGLVSGAGFFGGKMAHPVSANGAHVHDHGDGAAIDRHPPDAIPPRDATDDVTPGTPGRESPSHHDPSDATHPHSH